MKQQSKTFEASLTRLEEIVQRMENGDVPLEEALTVSYTHLTLPTKA